MTPMANALTTSTQAAIDRLRPTALRELSPVVADAQSLAVTTPAEFTNADIAVARIRAARTRVMERIEPIKKPLNEAKDAVMALQHELVDPLDLAEKVIRDKQAKYKRLEDARIAEENRKKSEEIQRLAREAEEKWRAEERARREEAEAARRAQEARTLTERRVAEQQANEARHTDS